MAEHRIEQVALADLVPNSRNYRAHPADQVERIAKSLQQHGQYRNVVLQAGTNRIIAGHGVIEAAKANGEETILAMVLEVGDAEAQQILIDDNELSRRAVDDGEQLMELLADLQNTEYQPLAFNDDEIEDLLRSLTMPRVVEEDEVPEPQAEAVTKPGDLWLLGDKKHRVLCGDCTVATDVERVMGGEKAEVLVFDPPYDDQELMNWRSPGTSWRSILAFADGRRADDVLRGWKGDIAPRWLFVWDGVTSWYVPGLPLARAKLCWWIGAAGSVYDSDGAHYGEPEMEPRVVSNTRGAYLYTPDPRGKHLADVFQRPLTQEHAEGPSHSKPVDWVRMLIGNCTKGELFDPFLGSGTTLIAAEQLGRVCMGIEIEPRYTDVICRRYSQLTGDSPTLEATGQTFAEVQADG